MFDRLTTVERTYHDNKMWFSLFFFLCPAHMLVSISGSLYMIFIIETLAKCF